VGGLAALVLASQVTLGWKAIAALIALALLLLLYLVASVVGGSWNPLKLAEGADGTTSTSKFQWLIWLIVVLFAYVFLWLLRAREGNYTAINDLPANLLAVLGFSTATAVGARPKCHRPSLRRIPSRKPDVPDSSARAPRIQTLLPLHAHALRGRRVARTRSRPRATARRRLRHPGSTDHRLGLDRRRHAHPGSPVMRWEASAQVAN
jgi:hypothetical protein